MLILPKVKKGVRSALTHVEKANKVIAGVALAIGISLSGVSAEKAEATNVPNVQQSVPQSSGAQLLLPASSSGIVTADHYSHESHASHESHYSHYSSRD